MIDYRVLKTDIFSLYIVITVVKNL